jgi:hypothetical protein
MPTKPIKPTVTPTATEAVRRAIQAREEAKTVLLEYAAENAEVIQNYQAMVEAHGRLEEEVKTAIRAAAAFSPKLKTLEFAPGYKFVRPVERRVNTLKLLEVAPDFITEHPEAVVIKAGDLDTLVDSGELPATVRNDVVVEEFGSPRCYVPPVGK